MGLAERGPVRGLPKQDSAQGLAQGKARGLAWAFLAATLGLTACVADPNAAGYGSPLGLGGAPAVPPSDAPGRRVAILLPLTGPNADVGQALLRAAQLSLDGAGGAPLDARDTGGTPSGAAEAARAALAGGAGILLGPLTAGETAAVAGVSRPAGVPVLAFTSDVTQAQPGVWTLGITPAQQVRRLAQAVRADGKTRLGAVLPQNAFGDALGTGLSAATDELGLPPPRVQRYGNGRAGLAPALKEVSAYTERHGAPGAPPADPVPPPPVDALLLAAGGPQLAQAAPLLANDDLGPAQVRLLGPATWAREAPQLGALSGAWYAAPDPTARAPFERAYAAKYGAPPRDLASLAYDAAGVARVAADRLGYPIGSLTRPQGFAGADGVFVLLPDGQVRRGLAIFEVDRAGSHLVQPAPGGAAAPGS